MLSARLNPTARFPPSSMLYMTIIDSPGFAFWSSLGARVQTFRECQRADSFGIGGQVRRRQILVRFYITRRQVWRRRELTNCAGLNRCAPGMFYPSDALLCRRGRDGANPTAGLVHAAIEILNHNKEAVAALTMMNLLRRRPNQVTGAFVAGG